MGRFGLSLNLIDESDRGRSKLSTMPEATKDSRQYAQCWCHKCRGGTVTKRTEYNHRAHPRAPVAPTSAALWQMQANNSRMVTEDSTKLVSGDRNGRIEEVEAADRIAKKPRVDENPAYVV